MKKIKTHFQKWNRWRKCNGNSKFYQFLVLIKAARSESFKSICSSGFIFEGLMEGIDSQLLRTWPKEGYPVLKVEEIDGGINVTIDVSK